MNVVIEELKRRITAIAAKVRRYQGRVDSYRQNTLFENNQSQFHREVDREEKRWDDDGGRRKKVLGKHMDSIYRS